jgi:hypothetical protein
MLALLFHWFLVFGVLNQNFSVQCGTENNLMVLLAKLCVSAAISFLYIAGKGI